MCVRVFLLQWPDRVLNLRSPASTLAERALKLVSWSIGTAGPSHTTPTSPFSRENSNRSLSVKKKCSSWVRPESRDSLLLHCITGGVSSAHGQITWWTGYRQPVFSRKELTFGVGGPINGYSWEATFIPLAQWGTVTFSVYSMLTANVYSLCMARAWLVFEGDQTAMWRGGLASGHYFGRGGSVWSGVLSGGAAPRRLPCLAAQGRQSLH